jgi:hypothetical protein
MESKGKEAYFKKPLEVSKKYPYHLKLEKSEFEKFTNFFKGDVQTPKEETQIDIGKSTEMTKEPENENKNVKLRGRRKDNKKEKEKEKSCKYQEIPIVAHESEMPVLAIEEMNSGKIYPTQYKFECTNTKPKDKCKINKKKYPEIPIIAHDTEKPSLAIEEMNSGKIFPCKWAYELTKNNKTKEKCKSNNNKKFAEIPIIAHDSEKPSLVIEEMRAGKIYPSPWSIELIKSSNANIKPQPKAKDKCNKCKDNNKKKYAEIPIVAHESEKPSLIFEEMNSGKLRLPSAWNCETKNTTTNIKNKDKCKVSKTNKKYAEIPIVVHESEKPSLLMEEMRSGKIYPYTWCKIQEKLKKNDIPIVVHESEGPSAVFEENGSGKLRSTVQTSFTNYKDNKQKTNILKSCAKKNLKKYKEVPVVSHEAESPSLVFEEINAGHNYKNIQTSVTEYKEDKSKKAQVLQKKPEKKGKKYEKCEIIVHESEGPSLVFEQNNSGKFYSNRQTSTTDYCKLKKLRDIKREKSAIVVHKSEKPSFVFEEANTGVLLDFNHQL